MSTWSPDDLDRIGRATELQVASRRREGSLRPYVRIWVVRAGNDLYVRSAHGPNNGWYARAKVSGEGRVQAGGVERDVSFEEPGPAVAGAVTAAYHAKYDRYGPGIRRNAEWVRARVTPVGRATPAVDSTSPSS